ncbi:hypothetical protein [Streptomyces sp. NPDC047315]|uniref:helix-turn-helix domain-containing protein n=1 Tax=Streptomyces sp. NPDC047315 TaxID=3155142 RepID=UPI0033CF6086
MAIGHAEHPDAASSPADLIRQLHRMKHEAGLTYREIAVRARESGDFLPSSTIAGALARDTLPREEVLVAFVRACTRDEEAVESWARARGAIAARAQSAPSPAPPSPVPPPTRSESAPGSSAARRRWRRPLLAAAVGTTCVTTAWWFAIRGTCDECGGARRTLPPLLTLVAQDR